MQIRFSSNLVLSYGVDIHFLEIEGQRRVRFAGRIHWIEFKDFKLGGPCALFLRLSLVDPGQPNPYLEMVSQRSMRVDGVGLII